MHMYFIFNGLISFHGILIYEIGRGNALTEQCAMLHTEYGSHMVRNVCRYTCDNVHTIFRTIEAIWSMQVETDRIRAAINLCTQ